jgi:ribosomal protein S18 acetylase RimI-like enzyme
MTNKHGEEARMPDQGIECRPMSPCDAGALALMYRELQSYHGYTQYEIDRLREQMEQADRNFEILLAERGQELLGFALFSIYPGPAVQPGIFLKELFVTDDSRGLGVGKHLMQALAETAIDKGYQRIDLTTRVDNARSRSFYERLGAKHDRERVFYRFDIDAITTIAHMECAD